MSKRTLLGLCLGLLLTMPAGADPVTLQELFTDQKAYDGKVLTLTGTVKNYYEKPDFCAFLLFDSGKAVSVYMPGHAGLKNDTRVTVTGPFSLSKKLSDRHFSNVVEASEVTPAP